MSPSFSEPLGWGLFGLVGTSLSAIVAQVSAAMDPPGSTVGGIGGGLAIGTAVGTAGGMIIAAIGNSLLKPWLESRVKVEALQALQAQVAALSTDNTQLNAKVDAFTAINADLSRKLNTLTDKNIALTSAMLVQVGRIKPLPAGAGLVGDVALPLDGPRVLLVEDEEVAREGMVSLLELLGRCRVSVAVDFASGLKAIHAADPPQFLLLDLMLPGGDGEDLLRVIRDEAIPIGVIVTTGRSEEMLGRVRALRPLAVFRKPVDVPRDVLPLILGGGVK